jgi:hypothetical protein
MTMSTNERAQYCKKLAEMRALPGADAARIAGFIVADYVLDRDATPTGAAARLRDRIEIALSTQPAYA